MQNADLEAQIVRNPDDPALYLVYADWLTERGDPRGELITVALRLEAEPGHAALEQRDAELHAQHDATWVGDLTVSNRVTLGWRRGFIDRVVLGDGRSRRRDRMPAHDALYAQLRALPAAALVRDLTFGHVDGDEADYDHCTAALVAHGAPASLRRLAYDRGSYWDISTTWVTNFGLAYPQLQRLEVLYFELGHMELGAIDLPALRELEVYTGGFTAANMRSVVDAHWPVLERLTLRFGGNEDWGADCELDDVLPLLAVDLPKLRHLGLGNARFLDELVPHLATARMLPQLTSLDLSLGAFGDAGAQAILDNAAAFRHLRRLDISSSYVSAGKVAALRALIPEVAADDQQDDDGDPEERYCQIGE